jgi:hypothetical protein
VSYNYFYQQFYSLSAKIMGISTGLPFVVGFNKAQLYIAFIIGFTVLQFNKVR